MIRAARYLGVAPWELYDQPICWQEWARTAENAENEAENQRAKDAQQSQG